MEALLKYPIAEEQKRIADCLTGLVIPRLGVTHKRGTIHLVG